MFGWVDENGNREIMSRLPIVGLCIGEPQRARTGPYTGRDDWQASDLTFLEPFDLVVVWRGDVQCKSECMLLGDAREIVDGEEFCVWIGTGEPPDEYVDAAFLKLADYCERWRKAEAEREARQGK